METVTVSPGKASPSGTVYLAGSKSFTNRALMVAAMAEGESIIEGVSLSADSKMTIEALERFGVTVNTHGDTATVIGRKGGFEFGDIECNVGDAGTAMRFLAALAALSTKGSVTLKGSMRMHERPIRDLVSALRQLGCEVNYLANEGTPPITVKGSKVKQDNIEIDGAVSSQFVSALLMIGARLPNGLQLKVTGTQVSRSYIDMTLQVMQDFGVMVKNDGYSLYKIGPQVYTARKYVIEGDVSGASYFWGLAAIGAGAVCVENIRLNSLQGDREFPKLLQQMGCQIIERKGENTDSIEVLGPKKLIAIRSDMTLMPDTAQTLAVVAAYAEGETVISGLSTLRGKETDRIAALKSELGKVGITCRDTADRLAISSGALRSARIATYKDHRMAMSFAMLGSRFPITIEEPGVVTKSYPGFWEELKKVGLKVEF